MFFNNLQKNQPAANVDQQTTIQSTPESTLCVELSDEELSAVNGGILTAVGSGVLVLPGVILTGSGVIVVHP
jgi:lactobin A/cerein 7B family class IIb bacteriocin